MNNGLGEPQTIVLLGGTSEIGLAIVERLASAALLRVVLACRDLDRGDAAADDLRGRLAARLGLAGDDLGVEVDVTVFDGADVESHQGIVEQIATDVGDIDVAIVAFALLGDASNLDDPASAVDVAHLNYTGTVSAMLALGGRMRTQGHGAIVLLSSVAGERVRAHNPVYGSTKAGIDAFAQGYGDVLAADGVHVLAVRPGFVRTKMTTGLDATPLSTTPEVVAEVTVAGLRARRRTVWAPRTLRPVFSVLRHLPGPIWRRLPLG